MAWCNGRLCVADTAANKLLFLSGADLDITGSVDLPGVSQPALDSKTGLLWTICGPELVALDSAGTVKQRTQVVEAPTLLAANNGRLAVYSTKTRKIHVYDSNDPAALKPLFTIGTGDDGYGKMQADRFWSPKAIALSASGEPRWPMPRAPASSPPTARRRRCTWACGARPSPTAGSPVTSACTSSTSPAATTSCSMPKAAPGSRARTGATAWRI